MIYKPSSLYYKVFTTVSPYTGAATDADSTPTATANKNGTTDAGFTLTVTNITTGVYKITGTVPSTYAAGDIVNVHVSATVAGVSTVKRVDTFRIEKEYASNLLQSGTEI